MAEIPDIKVDDPITEVIPSVKQVQKKAVVEQPVKQKVLNTRTSVEVKKPIVVAKKLDKLVLSKKQSVDIKESPGKRNSV